MSNIVITHMSGVFLEEKYTSSCFYDGLVKSLLEYGHNVLQVFTNEFLMQSWNGENIAVSKFHSNYVSKQIKDFNPDLIISFNNSSLRGIDKVVDCPIILWDADGFEFFNDKKYIINNQDRYIYFSFSEIGLKNYRRNLSSKNINILRVPSATAVQSHITEKKYDISFIGNMFQNNGIIIDFYDSNPQFLNIPPCEFDEKYPSDKDFFNKYKVNKSYVRYRSDNTSRVSTLLSLTDYNLGIFGPINWKQLSTIDINILKSYDSRAVFSLKHNESIYNRSKISLNCSHSQSILGYPWRVLDIMASNSALISSVSPLLKKDFPDINIPFYSSKHELLTQVSHMLKDDVFRQEYISHCNDIIDKSHRWTNRFPIITEVTGVDLSNQNKIGKYQTLNFNNNGLCYQVFSRYCSSSFRKKITFKVKPFLINSSRFKFLKPFKPDFLRKLKWQLIRAAQPSIKHSEQYE